jgi:ribosomal protein S25
MVVLLIYGSLFLSVIYYCLSAFWCAVVRTLELELEQRTNIKFPVKIGECGSKIKKMLLQVYGDNAMKKTAVYKCVTHFSAERESDTGEERSGWPATRIPEKHTAKLHQTVPENRRLTVMSIAEQANINREIDRKILTE